LCANTNTTINWTINSGVTDTNTTVAKDDYTITTGFIDFYPLRIVE